MGALSQKRSLSLTCFVFAGQNVHSGKFKHLKYSENVKFSGTNSIDSILKHFYIRIGAGGHFITNGGNFPYRLCEFIGGRNLAKNRPIFSKEESDYNGCNIKV